MSSSLCAYSSSLEQISRCFNSGHGWKQPSLWACQLVKRLTSGTGAKRTKPRAKLKHLLPLGGEPILVRLLQTIQCSGDMNHVIVAVAQHDHITLSALKEHYKSCAVISTTPICHSSISLFSMGSSSSAVVDDATATPTTGNPSHLATLTTITIVTGPMGPTNNTTNKTASSTTPRQPTTLFHITSKCWDTICPLHLTPWQQQVR